MPIIGMGVLISVQRQERPGNSCRVALSAGLIFLLND
jgi:hypothetical protein